MVLACAVALTMNAACSGGDSANNANTTSNTTTNNMTSGGNEAPVAEAGSNQSVRVGDTVTVNGAASTDPDGDPLTTAWSLSAPDGSEATLMMETPFRQTFIADVAGDYRVDLTVTDTQGNTSEDVVYIRAIATINRAPVAVARVAGDGPTFVDETIQLDGTDSTDPDGGDLTYTWSFLSRPTNSAAMLVDADAAEAELIPDLPGLYEVQLTVSDGELDSPPDSVVVDVMDVTNTNNAPVAIAGPDIDADLAMEVILDGSQSFDPDDGDTITYAWTLTSKPSMSTAMLMDADTANARFTPDMGGRYVASLVVSDGQAMSGADEIVIDVTAENANPPEAIINAPLRAAVGQPVTLDGTSSTDPDGDPLTYRWLLMDKPMGSAALLQDALTATPTLTPDVEGDYTVELVVNDGSFDSSPVTETITAGTMGPSCLLISEYQEGSSNNKAIELYNCGGNDLILDGIIVCLISNSSTTCSARESLTGTLPAKDVLGLCNSQLDMGLVDAGDCDVTSAVTNFNGNDRLLVYEDLDGDTDPDPSEILDAFGETSTEPATDWEDVGYQRCDLSPYDGMSSFTPTDFFDPVSTDDFSDFGDAPTQTSCMMIPGNTPPVADAGADVQTMSGMSVSLDGSNSMDAENDPLMYMWTLTSQPMNSTATLINPMTATPTLTPDVDGVYTVELVVNDGMADSTPDVVTITAGMVTPPSTCVVFSEYLEGSSNNKAVELYNCGSGPVDMAAQDLTVCLISNTSTSCSSTEALSGMLAAGDVYGICNSQLDMSKVSGGACDITSSVTFFNGNDRLVLFGDANGDGSPDAGEILDAFGEITTQPATDWEDVTYRRCSLTPAYTGTGSFTPTTLYTSAPSDDFSDFGIAPMLGGCP